MSTARKPTTKPAGNAATSALTATSPITTIAAAPPMTYKAVAAAKSDLVIDQYDASHYHYNNWRTEVRVYGFDEKHPGKRQNSHLVTFAPPLACYGQAGQSMVCCHTLVGTTDLWLQHVDFATREARTLYLPGYRNAFSSVTVRASDQVAFFVGEVLPQSNQYQVVVVNFARGAFYTLADDCSSPSIMLLPESLEIAYLTKDAKGETQQVRKPVDTPESGNTVLQALISTPSLISVPGELKHIITGYVTVAQFSIFTQVPSGIAITEGTGAWEHDPCGVVPAPKKKSWW